MEKSNLKITQLYPEYFFHPTLYSTFHAISAPRKLTGRIMKLLKIYSLTPSQGGGVPIFNNKYTHLKRVFIDKETAGNNLILLLEQSEVEAQGVTSVEFDS